MLLSRVMLAGVLFGLWWVLSGHAITLLLALGACTSLLIAFILPQVPLPGVHWLRWLRYGPWLLWRILIANLHVAALVLKGPRSLRPKVLTYKTALPSFPLRALLCQSITLTPGTITTQLEEQNKTLTVHSLDQDSSKDLTSGLMEGEVRRLA